MAPDGNGHYIHQLTVTDIMPIPVLSSSFINIKFRFAHKFLASRYIYIIYLKWRRSRLYTCLYVDILVSKGFYYNQSAARKYEGTHCEVSSLHDQCN